MTDTFEIDEKNSLQDFQDKHHEVINDEAATPEEREEALCKLIDEMVEESDSLRKMLDERDSQSYRYWRGRQWEDRKSRKQKGKQYEEECVNYIYPIIEQKVAMMTQNNPLAMFLPQSSDDEKYVKDIEALTKRCAMRRHIRSRLIEYAHAGQIFGRQAVHVYWDDTILGNPDVNFTLLMPSELIIDPKLRTTNIEDGQYVGIRRRVSLDYVLRRWPEHAKRILEENGAEKGYSVIDDNIDNDSLEDELDKGVEGENTTYDLNYTDTRDRRECEIVSMWFHDYSTQRVSTPVPMDVLVQDGTVVEHAITKNYVFKDSGEPVTLVNQPKEEVEVPAYPTGRFTIKVGTVILEDGAWSGNWPIALGNSNPMPYRWFGIDETEAMRAGQNLTNDIASIMKDHMRANIHGNRKAISEAVKNKDDLKANGYDPDRVIWMNNTAAGINGVQWEYPPAMSSDVYNLYERYKADIEMASGVSGVSMGRVTTSNKSATEISILERAGQGRVGMAAALFDDFICKLYSLIAQCIQQNYDVGMTIRILGDEGQQTAIEIQQRHKDVAFDVQVEPGSTMPYDKDKKKQDALTLNQVTNGAYLPEVLSAFEVRNKEEVLQRVQAWQLFKQYEQLLMDPMFQQYLQTFTASMQQGQQGQQVQGASK